MSGAGTALGFGTGCLILMSEIISRIFCAWIALISYVSIKLCYLFLCPLGIFTDWHNFWADEDGCLRMMMRSLRGENLPSIIKYARSPTELVEESIRMVGKK